MESYWQTPGEPGDPVQVAPEAQSVLPVHIVLQTAFVVSHENGAQLVVEGVHWPAALQAEVVSVIPSGQLTGAQVVPAG
jgi:hypothetical protein